MALKSLIQFAIFAPPNPPSPRHRSSTELRFSRWNNANAEKFIRRERTQKEIEDQIRFEKRFDTALNIAHNYNPAPPHPTFKSTGTPSSPSQPSIPGKFSKYSKKFTENRKVSGLTHPAFRPVVRPRKIPEKREDGYKDGEDEARNEASFTTTSTTGPKFTIDENGVAYEIPNAPFAYQYSYTETPKVKPVKIREPLVSPFGPDSMNRPWTGRKPLPSSKKKLPEFDSFKLPPPHKKGVKPVQAPGPFLQGTGPRYVKSRVEILGDPLTKEEVEELLKSCRNTTRQLNIGRDGLTHNMLENIHAHWKRRRVCKIKCKGVCTVDIDNVHHQLEEKTGGKIIYNKGGLVYLFRGRNYNYKTRPRFPLMLWRPVSPMYPRLIKRAPEGLTLEEATEMRKKGRNLIPICKLAKNGVYADLAKHVREAFEACELVRINCQGLNGSDYRKIGAKLKDLVPCVLISFEYEHILLWRGHSWKSSLPEMNDDDSKIDKVESTSISIDVSSVDLYTSNSLGDGESVESDANNALNKEDDKDLESDENETESPLVVGGLANDSISSTKSNKSSELSDGSGSLNNRRMVLPADEDQFYPSSMVPPPPPLVADKLQDNQVATSMPCTEAVQLLLKQAVESGSAIILNTSDLNADIIYKRATALAKSAPPGPIFKRLPRKLKVESDNKPNDGCSEVITIKMVIVSEKKEDGVSGRRGDERKSPKSNNMKGIRSNYLNIAPQGSLRVDELAKLLS